MRDVTIAYGFQMQNYLPYSICTLLSFVYTRVLRGLKFFVRSRPAPAGI